MEHQGHKAVSPCCRYSESDIDLDHVTKKEQITKSPKSKFFSEKIKFHSAGIVWDIRASQQLTFSSVAKSGDTLKILYIFLKVTQDLTWFDIVRFASWGFELVWQLTWHLTWLTWIQMSDSFKQFRLSSPNAVWKHVFFSRYTVLYSLVYHEIKSFCTTGHSIHPVKKMSIDWLEEHPFAFRNDFQLLLINHITRFIRKTQIVFSNFVAQQKWYASWYVMK